MLRKLLRFRLATITVTAVIILFISDVLYFTPPWKITDPTDPNFEITEFKLEDYWRPSSSINIRDVLKEIFPANVSLRYVELVFRISDKNLKISRNETTSYKLVKYDFGLVYFYGFKSGVKITVLYDKADRLIDIFPSGGTGALSDQSLSDYLSSLS